MKLSIDDFMISYDCCKASHIKCACALVGIPFDVEGGSEELSLEEASKVFIGLESHCEICETMYNI